MKKREFDIFGLLLGVVIGCILGFFLSTRIDLSQGPSDNEPIHEEGYVHLLQIDKLSTAAEAVSLKEVLMGYGYQTVEVLSNGYYYVYGGIALSPEELNDLFVSYTEKGYEPLIKKEHLLDKPNAVIDNQEEFDFWTECIDNLLKSLNDDQITISDEYHNDREHMEVLYCLTSLMVVSPAKKDYFHLVTYELIVETLG
jgi:hypothetical protein